MDPQLTLSALSGLGALGLSLRWNWWRPAKKGIPVLMYHKMGTPPPESRQKALWVSRRQFEWQMDYVLSKGFQTVTFADLAGDKIAGKPLIITFDDGYLNQHVEALPALASRGMKGVFYIVTEAIGRDNFWHDPKKEPRSPMMDLASIQDLLSNGMEIGSHAMTHRRFLTLSEDDAKREFEQSKKKLEELLGIAVYSFAFPYGNGEDNAPLVQAAFQAGYRWALGVHAGIWSGAQQEIIPRIYVRGDDWKLDFFLKLTRGRSRF